MKKETLRIPAPPIDASLEEIEAWQRATQLGGLQSTREYLDQSADTRKWNCPNCGSTDIPCSIPCPQCQHNRPKENWDKDTEGKNGLLRLKAIFRRKTKIGRSPLR
ncbi:MAG: hypothetical protein WA152_00245 [Microgenomates group bacterium]